MSEPRLDVITIGRSSVDLYGVQVGGRLEDMASFSKAVGGCPTNIAIGTARLGLKSGLITRVGDEHMGRFIREQCAREGVDVTGVHTDPERLTSLVLLGIRDEKTFPLIFYRDNCADGALDESDIDPAYIESAKAVLVSGTHFARAHNAAAQLKAMKIARDAGRKVVFDIDFRPNLWGLGRPWGGRGALHQIRRRFAETERCPAAMRPHRRNGRGDDDRRRRRRSARARSKRCGRSAPRRSCLKRGPMGCVVFPAPFPRRSRRGCAAPAFRSRFITCWARATPSCPASCAAGSGTSRSKPAAPTPTPTAPLPCRGCSARRNIRPGTELSGFLEARFALPRPSPRREPQPYPLGDDAPAGARDRSWPSPSTIALSSKKSPTTPAPARADQRLQAARGRGGRKGRGRPAGLRHAARRQVGREALFRAVDHFWIARPVEEPGSRPLDFEFGGSLAAKLEEWPVAHTIKCLCFYHPD